MNQNEFKCARCLGVFEKAWTDGEAEQEAKKLFGVSDAMKHPGMSTVCDTCFKEVGLAFGFYKPEQNKELSMRETDKWKILFNETLKEVVKEKGLTKKVADGQEVYAYDYLIQSYEDFIDGKPREKVDLYRTKYKEVSAMPDRIKEAEEYADEIYKALR